MKNKKMAFSIIINVMIVFMVFFCVRQYFVSVGDANMVVSGWVCMRYFTILSNIFCALTSLILIVFEVLYLENRGLIPKWLKVMRFLSTVSVGVTFLTCVFVLAPYEVALGMSYFHIFSGGGLFLHFIVPVLAIFSTVYLENSNGIKMKNFWIGCASVYAYAMVYIPLVLSEVWPDFYGFTFGGHAYFAPISIAFMMGLTLLVSYFVLKLSKKCGNR